MSTSLRLTVLTPDRVLLVVDSATKVRMKLADDAWLSVYPDHAPLIAEVLPGPVQYDTDTESGGLSISEGIVQVTAGQVTVLTSGPQRGPRAAETRPASDQQFDRLAKQLLTSLRAQPFSEVADAESVDAESVDAESADAESVDAEPADAESADAESADAPALDGAG